MDAIERFRSLKREYDILQEKISQLQSVISQNIDQKYLESLSEMSEQELQQFEASLLERISQQETQLRQYINELEKLYEEVKNVF